MTSLAKLQRVGAALLAPRMAVLGDDPCGGSEVVLWEDVEILRRAGIPLRVYASAARNGAPVNTIPLRTRAPLVTSVEYCGKFLRAERNALLLAYNEPSIAGMVPGRAIVRFDWDTPLPRYWRVPGWKSRFRKSLYLFPSQSEQQRFLERHEGIPEASTQVLPNAVDLRLFRPEGQAGGGGLRVGFAGQWVPRKGLATLLEAWLAVKRSLPEAELCLAGGPHLWRVHEPPPGSAEIAERVESMERQSLLCRTGMYKRNEMPGFWNSVSVAVVPSSYEPFGLVALEALACGVPVVASEVGGLREIVVDKECGLLVPPNDSERLAAALITILTDQDLRGRLSHGARKRAEEFSLDRRAEAFLKLLADRSQRF